VARFIEMCISSAPTAAARSIVERANAPNRNGIVLAYGFGRTWTAEFVVRASKLDCLRTRASSVRKSPSDAMHICCPRERRCSRSRRDGRGASPDRFGVPRPQPMTPTQIARCGAGPTQRQGGVLRVGAPESDRTDAHGGPIVVACRLVRVCRRVRVRSRLGRRR
jgi:hypothetical protein